MDWLTKQSLMLELWLQAKSQSVSGGLSRLGSRVIWWTWILLVLSLTALSILLLVLSQCFYGVLQRTAGALKGLKPTPKV